MSESGVYNEGCNKAPHFKCKTQKQKAVIPQTHFSHLIEDSPTNQPPTKQTNKNRTRRIFLTNKWEKKERIIKHKSKFGHFVSLIALQCSYILTDLPVPWNLSVALNLSKRFSLISYYLTYRKIMNFGVLHIVLLLSCYTILYNSWGLSNYSLVCWLQKMLFGHRSTSRFMLREIYPTVNTKEDNMDINIRWWVRLV